MNLKTLIILNKKDSQFNIIFSNIDENITDNLLTKLQDNFSVLDDKNELLLPMLDIQIYIFFYKINSKDKSFIFCILSNVEDRNLFFNEIPFIKFKSQQCKILLDLDLINEHHVDLNKWFTVHNIDKDFSLNNIVSFFPLERDISIFVNSLLTGKKLMFVSEDANKLNLISPFLYICSPHRYLNINNNPKDVDNLKVFDILFRSNETKPIKHFILIKIDKQIIINDGEPSSFATNLIKKMDRKTVINQSTIKNEFRQIIINTISILELFQNKTEDLVKTKTIETMKKSLGIDDYQLVLDIAKSINRNIEDQVNSFTKMEKKYSSFLSEF